MTTADAAPKRKSELGTRMILGPLMIAIVAGVYWADRTIVREAGHEGVLSAAVLALLALGGVYEVVAMFRHAGFVIAAQLLYLATVLLCGSAFCFGWMTIDGELVPAIVATMGLYFAVALVSLRRKHFLLGLELQGGTMLAFLLVAVPMFFAQGLALLHLPSVLFVVLVCKGGDIGAYLVGSAIGKHKLIPHISGGKTVEGAIGSLASSTGLAVGFAPVLLEPGVSLGLTGAVLVGIMLNVTTQTGDLIESLFKRRCHVKDSGALLPAHGGVLDLIDSLLFSFPAYFLVVATIT